MRFSTKHRYAGIDTVGIRRADETLDRGRTFAACVGAGKQIVPSIMEDFAQQRELALRWLSSLWSAPGCSDESHPVGEANGHASYAYLKDIPTRLPTQPASRPDELLPHLWQPWL